MTILARLLRWPWPPEQTRVRVIPPAPGPRPAPAAPPPEHGTCAICRTETALVVRRLCLPCAAMVQRMGYGDCLEEQARIDRRLGEIGR